MTANPRDAVAAYCSRHLLRTHQYCPHDPLYWVSHDNRFFVLTNTHQTYYAAYDTQGPLPGQYGTGHYWQHTGNWTKATGRKLMRATNRQRKQYPDKPGPNDVRSA